MSIIVCGIKSPVRWETSCGQRTSTTNTETVINTIRERKKPTNNYLQLIASMIPQSVKPFYLNNFWKLQKKMYVSLHLHGKIPILVQGMHQSDVLCQYQLQCL